jgi:hypothetical protein
MRKQIGMTLLCGALVCSLMGCAAKNSSDDVQNTKDEVSSSANDAQEADTSAESTDAEDLAGSDDVTDTDGADTDAADDQETEENSENLTLGESLLATFKEAAEAGAQGAQELADAVIANDVLTSHERKTDIRLWTTTCWRN